MEVEGIGDCSTFGMAMISDTLQLISIHVEVFYVGMLTPLNKARGHGMAHLRRYLGAHRHQEYVETLLWEEE